MFRCGDTIALIVGVAAVFVGSGGCTPEVSLPPSLVFERTAQDLGMIEEGTVTEARFVFTNEGGGVLKITDISASCGCTVVDVDKRALAPGETGELVASIKSKGGSGPRTSQIVISSNDPRHPKTTLRVEGHICKRRLRSAAVNGAVEK